jgi:hypothetical protein
MFIILKEAGEFKGKPNSSIPTMNQDLVTRILGPNNVNSLMKSDYSYLKTSQVLTPLATLGLSITPRHLKQSILDRSDEKSKLPKVAQIDSLNIFVDNKDQIREREQGYAISILRDALARLRNYSNLTRIDVCVTSQLIVPVYQEVGFKMQPSAINPGNLAMSLVL